jgi:hypothetical protein
MQYLFLLPSTTENYIVCSTCVEQTILHIGTFVNSTSLRFDIDCGIPRSTPIQFASHDDLLSYVRDINPHTLQGVICFAPNGCQYKIVNSSYAALCAVRGNEASINFRYLQIRNDEAMVRALESLYPEHVAKFREYDECIVSLAKTIYDAYVSRFIQRNRTVVPKDEFRVLSATHTWFIEQKASGQNNRVNQQVVLKILTDQSPVTLNRMIKSVIQEKKRNTIG